MVINIKKFEKATKRIGKCGYNNVQHKTYPQMRHEILNEIGKQRVWSDILTFIGSD